MERIILRNLWFNILLFNLILRFIPKSVINHKWSGIPMTIILGRINDLLEMYNRIIQPEFSEPITNFNKLRLFRLKKCQRKCSKINSHLNILVFTYNQLVTHIDKLIKTHNYIIGY
jgi:hypothetical protein